MHDPVFQSLLLLCNEYLYVVAHARFKLREVGRLLMLLEVLHTEVELVY